jgi:hypothetical protein
MLDVALVLLVAVFMLVGYMRGVLHGALMCASLLIAYRVSAELAAPFALIFLQVVEAPSSIIYTLGRLTGGVVAFCSLAVAAGVLDARFGRTPRGYLQPWNRNMGWLAGLTFGALVAFCILCAADAFNKAYPEAEGGLAAAVRNSQLRTLVSPYNPADRLFIVDSLRLMRAATEEPAKLEKLKQHTAVARLLDSPKIQAVLDDAELMESIRRHDIPRIASDKKILAIIQDEELRSLLFSDSMRQAIHEAMEEKPSAAKRQAAP